MVPGIYDCHTHISWNDFYREDRERRGAAENAERTAKSVELTLRGGITSARDAGGADAALQAAIASGSLIGPNLQISVDMIGPADAGSPSAMRGAVKTAIDKGAQWIKLLATEGSSTPSDEVLRSNFTREEFYAATDTALRGGARVMVHTWGGDSADWAIEAGATSLEHGIFLTRNQVTRAAAAGLTLVPTLTIYRHVRDMVVAGDLANTSLSRITDVLAVHEDAVRLARDNGLALALGTDFTTPWQHGTNIVEIGALMRAGLTSAEALLSATRNGAELLRDGGTGLISVGHRADAVLFGQDPTEPSTFDHPASVVAVVKNGRIVHSVLLGLGTDEASNRDRRGVEQR